MTTNVAFLRLTPEPPLAAPIFARGALAWMRENLFSSVSSTILTIVLAAFALWLIPGLIAWATTNAVWSAMDGGLCRAHQDGACWAFIGRKLDYFRYGSYPEDERWRVDAAEIIGSRADRLAPVAAGAAPRRRRRFVLPRLSRGRVRTAARLGLARLADRRYGSLGRRLRVVADGPGRHRLPRCPLGVLLALGRRSKLPIVKAASVIYIETICGVLFHHGPFHGQQFAAAFRAGGVVAGPAAAPADRHGAFQSTPPISPKRCAAACNGDTQSDSSKARWRSA